MFDLSYLKNMSYKLQWFQGNIQVTVSMISNFYLNEVKYNQNSPGIL